MPEVTFYVLPTYSQQERLDFACKLIEKIYRSDSHCYVLTDSAQQADMMDKQLWSFRPGSFIPHQIYQGTLPELPQTILIGGADIPPGRQNVILNLSANTPAINEQTQRILEILDNSEECKQAGRQRYRHYQQLNLEIVTHKM